MRSPKEKPADRHQTGTLDEHRYFSTPKMGFKSRTKLFLVALGLKRVLPKRLCTYLINKLGLRGE